MKGQRTRYREERTLARTIVLAAGQSKDEFTRAKIRLKRHCQQFNTDVGTISQWVMGFRPGGKRSSAAAETAWTALLAPELVAGESEEPDLDSFRVEVFDYLTGLNPEASEDIKTLPGDVAILLAQVAGQHATEHSRRMSIRLQGLTRAHRSVLIKAAADLINAKYVRAKDNWEQQHPHWLSEKNEWESRHPELTAEVRSRLTAQFKRMKIALKSPRVCTWEALQANKDNCRYAGQRLGTVNHGALCIKYDRFLREQLKTKFRKSEKLFSENASIYLRMRREGGKGFIAAMNDLLAADRRRTWFQPAWLGYLAVLGLNEDTILKKYEGKLPHCTPLKGTTECSFNVHTNACREYRDLLLKLTDEDRRLEGEYREWRKNYLSGPRKPTFRYPSSRDLTIPKIFGAGYHEVDFERSIVRLRLDDMAAGEFLEFAFRPWPSDYDRQPRDICVTSVSVHFVGNRPRVNFRFEVAHKPSGFGVSQDQLDELRSRVYPRQHQDQSFLDAARRMLCEGWQGGSRRDFRMLAVDLGETGACAAIYNGQKFEESVALQIIKLDRLYSTPPETKTDDVVAAEPAPTGLMKKKGLNKEHVGFHLESIAREASQIARHRPKTITSDTLQLQRFDLRRRTRHVTNMIRDWVRLNAAQVIDVAEASGVDLIVFESLRGFRAPDYAQRDEEKKLRMAFFAYGRVRRKVSEKAVERGMRVVTVPYLSSSQHCSKCGRKQANLGLLRKNKKSRRFECEFKECGYKGNSDENAARVIGRVFWGEIVLPRTLR